MSVKQFHKRIEVAVRLDVFLRENLPAFFEKNNMRCVLSNSKIRRLIVAGAITVNNRQIRIPGYELNIGSEVTAFIDEDKFFFEKQPDDIHFELTEKDVLFEDEYLILVNKPPFFPTEATIVGNRDNLHDAVVRYLWNNNPALRNPPYVGIMHRLDRETSGVILFTKQRSVNAAVHQMFDSSSGHSAKKVYRAVCDLASAHCGSAMKLQNEKSGFEFCVEMFMGRISSKSQAAKWGRLPENRGGLFSHTDFTVLQKMVLKSGKEAVVVEARPSTGRTHQIRVHLASVGLPIMGDELYGSKSEGRIMLHACSLEFVHPVIGEKLKIEAPLPEGF